MTLPEFILLLRDAIPGGIRLAIPLIFAALAGLFSERSGVFDIGLEGKMLAAAFAAATMAFVTGSAWMGLLGAIGVSMAMSLLHGFASITNKGNQIVSGVAINFIAAGLTAVLGQAWFAQGGRTPQLPNSARFDPWTLPGISVMNEVPVLGWIYRSILSGQNTLTYLAFLSIPIAWWVLYRTRFGLRLRAVGDNPAAVDTAGISVTWLRYRAVLCTGFLCGFAGAYLSIAQSAAFIKDMSAGKGFIALAALIFAKWKPVPVLFACLLFGYLDSVAIRLQGKSMPLVGEVPVQIFQALPYILTVVLLAGFIGVAIPPRAGGIPYTKER
jgi:general nucleoside transport system permease protein